MRCCCIPNFHIQLHNFLIICIAKLSFPIHCSCHRWWYDFRMIKWTQTDRQLTKQLKQNMQLIFLLMSNLVLCFLKFEHQTLGKIQPNQTNSLPNSVHKIHGTTNIACTVHAIHGIHSTFCTVGKLFVGKTWHKIQHHQNYIHLIWDLSVRYWTSQRRQQFMNLFAKKKPKNKRNQDGKRKTNASRSSGEQMIWEFSVFLRCALSICLFAWLLARSFLLSAVRHRNRSFFVCVSLTKKWKKKKSNWNICTFSVARRAFDNLFYNDFCLAFLCESF